MWASALWTLMCQKLLVIMMTTPMTAARTHVPGKYRMRLGDAQNISRREVDIDLHKEDTVLLKEQGLY